MSFPRTLLLSLLMVPCTATLAAQSSQGNGLFAPVPLLGVPAPPPNSLTHVPALAPNALGETPGRQVQAPFKLSGPNGRLVLQGKPFGPTPLRGPLATGQMDTRRTLARNNSPCYTIRSYQFTQEDPASDATRFASYSTCLPGAQLMLKGAKDSHATPSALEPALVHTARP